MFCNCRESFEFGKGEFSLSPEKQVRRKTKNEKRKTKNKKQKTKNKKRNTKNKMKWTLVFQATTLRLLANAYLEWDHKKHWETALNAVGKVIYGVPIGTVME